jgi:two-component system, response regulator
VILLVEDNPADIALTLRAFKMHNLANEIVVARDGVEALEYLHGTSGPDDRPNHALPKLVLLDLELPKVEGLEVLRRVRSEPRTRLLPIVVLTSSDEQRDIVMSYGLGANSYVRKPVVFEEFVDAARYLGLYWLVLNKPAPEHADPVH